MEELNKNIEEFAKDTLGKNFEFRNGQKEIIHNIISSILDNETTKYVCEAPTGSGKSIIALICAGVLAKYYDKKSYILASDVGLWNQYADFIKKHPKLNFGKLKGMDNYTCSLNGSPITERECKLSGMSISKLLKNHEDFECFNNCKYMKDVKSAIYSNVTLLTYAKFITLNFDLNSTLFSKRDVLFCDECHNIPEIVQLYSSSTLKFSNIKRVLQIFNILINISSNDLFFIDSLNEDYRDTYDYIIKKYKSQQSIIEMYNKLFVDCINAKNQQDINDSLSELCRVWKEFDMVAEMLIYYISKTYSSKKSLSEEHKEILSKCNILKGSQELNGLAVALHYADFYGYEYLVRDIDLSDIKNPKIIIRFAKEDIMIKNSLLNKTSSTVMLSATVGDIDSFKENLGLLNDPDVIFKRLDSHFDFSKSPIYFINRYKMSYDKINESIDNIEDFIYRICTKHCDQRGIIQTASYALVKKIINDAPTSIKNRIIIYESSKEKDEALRKFKRNANSIIIGPSVNEGIDLPGDMCRFIIITKIPYPNLTDGLVNAKIRLFPKWYTSMTSNKIIQGIGRGNRYEDDWCTTYILDACFKDLYSKTWKQYPDYLRKRLKEKK